MRGEDQHAQTFNDFADKVLKAYKQKQPSEVAQALLESLLSTKSAILDLPTTIKESDCTIARFYLLLLPLINLVEETSRADAMRLTSQLFSFLITSDYGLNVKTTA